MSNNEKKDLSADELIRQLNISLGLSPEGLEEETQVSDDNDITDGTSEEINDELRPDQADSDAESADDTEEYVETTFDTDDDSEEIEVVTDDCEKELFETEKTTDTLGSILGFSDTLDRLDETVSQPAPIRNASSPRGVNSINVLDKEPEVERKIFFDDADFEEIEEDPQPTSAFEKVTVDPESDTKTIIITSDDEEEQEEPKTQEVNLTREFESSEEPQEEPKQKFDLTEQLAFDQMYSENETSSDGYDDTEHEIMDAFNFNEALEDLYNDDSEILEKKKEKKQASKNGKQSKKQAKRTVSDEYVNAAQNKPFLEKYKKRYHSIRLRILGAVLFTVALIFMESAVNFGVNLPHFLDPVVNSRVLALVCLQLFLICCSFVVNSIINGLKGLLTGNFSSDVMTFVFSTTTFIYGIFLCVTASQNLLLMFSPCALCICVSLVSEYRDLKREISTFKIVSSSRMKYTVEKYIPSEKSIEKNEFFDYLPENPELLKINKTSFVSNFVANFSGYSKQRSVFGIITLVCLLLFVVSFGIMIALKSTITASLTSAFTVLCAIMPISLYTAFSLPLYKTSKEAYKEDSAFVGERVADEFSSVSVVSFDDKEVFPPYYIQLRGFRTYADARNDHVLFVVNSIFSKLGGPLKEVISESAHELGKTDNVKIHSVYEDGVEADVDEEHILIGSAAFMEEKHYIPVYTVDDEDAERNNSKRIMYVAFGGTIVAKFYIKYGAEPDFAQVLRHLTDSGMCIAIKTFDPNIDTALLANEINIKKYPVRVVKCEDREEMSSTSQSADATIISRGSAKSLLKTLTNCRKLSSVIRTGTLISTISIIISVMIMVFLHIADISNVISSLAVVIYHLVWISVTRVFTGASIR